MLGKFGGLLFILGAIGLFFSYFVENTFIPLGESDLIITSIVFLVIGFICLLASWGKPRYPTR